MSKDLFSERSHDYARYRPHYPDALFTYLAALAPARTRAWDCATGNGQAALPLAAHFEEVVATDLSSAQLAEATAHPRVRYQVGTAEESGLPDDHADLIAVAQSFHWFEHARFAEEVRRVGREGALLAVWGYTLLSADARLDEVVHAFEAEVDPYWPPERRLLDERYESISLPFPKVQADDFAMEIEWSLGHLIGYLDTWSSVRAYRRALCRDPVAEMRAALERAWGDPRKTKTISWPLHLKLWRVEKGRNG